MTTGLKQMVSDALAEPVEVSGEATLALSQKMREWSGWSDSTLVFGDPGRVSPFASCDHSTRTFIANADRLILNPHRVLVTVTPFRLKQEAVLTGCLLHEAGHARHSLWLPRTKEQAKANPLRHGDGSQVTTQTVALARLMEEPRIEGLQYRDADRIGAAGLGWTMRASAAHLIPTTQLSMDPDMKIMNLIESWALRAGRQIALAHWTPGFQLRSWVQDFTTLVNETIEAHIYGINMAGDSESDNSSADARKIMDLLLDMIRCDDDRGTTMIDKARDVLALLFPETDPDDQPEAGGGCTQQDSQPEDKQEQSDEGEQEQSDEGEQDQSDEPNDTEGTEPDQSDSEGEPEQSDSDGDGETEGEPESEPEGEGDSETGDASSSSDPDSGDPDSGDHPGEDEAGPETDTESDLAQQLADMEALAKDETEEETEEEAEGSVASGGGAGDGGEGSLGEGWRLPTPEERGIQKGAERFLRGLIEPSEASKTSLSDSPSATVDGAALAAWRAAGQTTEPRFFRRTQRNIEPSPPVKVAILVDVSGSMEELQTPSAVLSWALACAALDLRNFAGRGQQIESTLIHWGSTARVVQRNGQMLPGIREVLCLEGTSAMHDALDLVEQELPGFFDLTEKPVHRLLVQFTDWELSPYTLSESRTRIQRALAAGVNMVTVAPHDYSPRYARLDEILAGAKEQRGLNTLMRYNKMFPEQVWDTAAESLR